MYGKAAEETRISSRFFIDKEDLKEKKRAYKLHKKENRTAAFEFLAENLPESLLETLLSDDSFYDRIFKKWKGIMDNRMKDNYIMSIHCLEILIRCGGEYETTNKSKNNYENLNPDYASPKEGTAKGNDSQKKKPTQKVPKKKKKNSIENVISLEEEPIEAQLFNTLIKQEFSLKTIYEHLHQFSSYHKTNLPKSAFETWKKEFNSFEERPSYNKAHEHFENIASLYIE